MRKPRRSVFLSIYGMALVSLSLFLLSSTAFPQVFVTLKKFESGALNAPVDNNSSRQFIIYVPDSGYIWNVVAQVHFSQYKPEDCTGNPGATGRIDEVGLRLKDPATGTWILLKSTDGGIGEIFDGTFDDSAAGYPGFTPNCGSLFGVYRPRDPLSIFDSHPVTGNWVLEIEDNICSGCSTGYGPTLHDWSVTVSFGSDIFPPVWNSGVGLTAQDAGKGGKVNLTWNAAFDYSAPITYNIYWAASSGAQDFATPNATTSSTSYTASGLTNGQQYHFVVRSEDAMGNESANLDERSAVPTAPVLTAPYLPLLLDD